MSRQTTCSSHRLCINCRKRRLQRIISPTRNDAFAMGDQTPDASVRTYADVMREQQLARERDNTLQNIRDKQRRSVHVLHFFKAEW